MHLHQETFNLELNKNDENPSEQGLDGTNSTAQRSKDLLRSNKEANPATADQVTYFLTPSFKMEKDPNCQGSKV